MYIKHIQVRNKNQVKIVLKETVFLPHLQVFDNYFILGFLDASQN